MSILITNAIQETTIFAIILALVIVMTTQKTQEKDFFSRETTTELKGLAILFVLFSHIGYFLVSDPRFLVPLSNYGGVGVDIFFLLSGFGLASTALQQPLSAWQFYKKRLTRIFVPVLTTVLLFVGLDYFFHNQTYALKTIIQNIFGFFPRADLWLDLDSPLWYITPLLFYYIMFPLVFWRRFPLLSATALTVLSWKIIQWLPTVNVVSIDLVKMYRLHILSFPVGIIMASLLQKPWLGFEKTKIMRMVGIAIALGVIYYMALHPQVGAAWKKEALASLLISLMILMLFVLKKISSRALVILGTFSFEIYLLHWPILSRYNFLYGTLPAAGATIVYILFLLGLSWIFQIFTQLVHKRTTASPARHRTPDQAHTKD